MLNKNESKKSGPSNDENVIQLGFNISVSGKSASDIEVFVNDKKDGYKHLSSKKIKELKSASSISEEDIVTSNLEQTEEKNTGLPSSIEKSSDSHECALKGFNSETDARKSLSPSCSSPMKGDEVSRNEDLTIVDEIRNAIGNFDRFSEHVKEIPRLKTHHIYTSTPKPDRKNSRSEGNLSVITRSYIPKYDFRDGKYYKKSKSSCSDLFLKPLPGEDYFKKSYFRRHYNVESYHHYTSVDSIPQYYGYAGEYKIGRDVRGVVKSDNEKSEVMSSSSEAYTSEPQPYKKGGSSEFLDKQSTSSESAKDIKIYQSGGVIIMQNFQENAERVDAKELMNASKIMEDCDKLLREKVENSSGESPKPLVNSSSEAEVKEQPGKLVHFNLPSCESAKSKSCESLPEINKAYDHRAFPSGPTTWKYDFARTKDCSSLVSQNQDFTSLSTQENDSVVSNLLGMSPTSSTCDKKLEWDSGADVGYLNVDLTKENISTIERIILKGLSDNEKTNKVIYQKSNEEGCPHPNKFILEKIPSELEVGRAHNSSSSNGTHDTCSREFKETTSKKVSREKSDEDSWCLKKKRSHVDVTSSSNFSDVEASSKTNTDNIEAKYEHSSKKSSVKSQNVKQGKYLVQKKKFTQQIVSTNVEEKIPRAKSDEKETVTPSVSDKSTFINTLFDDYCFELPLQNISRSEESGRSDSSDKRVVKASSRNKRLTKKKSTSQEGDKLSILSKDKVSNNVEIDEKSASRTKEPLGGNDPVKILGEDKSDPEEVGCMDKSERKDAKKDTPSSSSAGRHKNKAAQSRPISASSSSIRTVMPNIEINCASENVIETEKVSDQMIQTTQMEFESKGIQAFLSNKCSATSSRITEGNSSFENETHSNTNGVHFAGKDDISKFILSCSKSIQATGMNSSLPKHLAHPKQTDSYPQHNSKSTQVFGGSVMSLPNYHSNVVGKETSIVNMNNLNDNVKLGMKTFRVQEGNERNAGTGKRQETSMKIVESDNNLNLNRHHKKYGTSKSKSSCEDKENVSLDEEEHKCEVNSRNFTELSEIDGCSAKKGSRKSESLAFGSCDVHMSDGSESVFLTSELLKEHGEIIDRNIIQEKYFESQLRELRKGREMVSRSTSMEKQMGSERITQTSYSLKAGISVSCQYSPVNANEEQLSTPATYGNSREEDARSRQSTLQEVHTKKPYLKSNKTLEKSDFGKDVDTGGSLSTHSDTQTAHSWVPGMQQDALSTNCTIGRALSFEYLPGHIYEDPVNLRENSPAEVIENLNLCDVIDVDSSPCSGNQAKESESPHTVVLENTDRTVDESDHMKNLDINLAELQMVVSRLHEKEAVFQKITNSVLTTVTKANGSGDSPRFDVDENLPNKHFIETDKNPIVVDGKQCKGLCVEREKKVEVNPEMSTACHPENLTPKPEELHQEVNKLELRVNEEKQQQIKWIEKEINHLKMLRSLLEKEENRSLISQKRKRHHYLTESKESEFLTETLKNNVFKDLLSTSLPKSVTSNTNPKTMENSKVKIPTPTKQMEKEPEIDSLQKFIEMPCGGAPNFGMSLSLRRTNNVQQQVTMLPVGVQVTLRQRKSSNEACTSTREKKPDYGAESSEKRRPRPGMTEYTFRQRNNDSDLDNHYNVRTFGVNKMKGSCRCMKCNKGKCNCLKVSEQTLRNISTDLGKCQSSVSLESSPCANSVDRSVGEEEQEIKIPEVFVNTSEGVSSIDSADLTLSQKSSNQDQNCISNSSGFDNCVCGCHAKPLPRCDSCHLLNTCKKCRCYKRIVCCHCESDAPSGLPKESCNAVGTRSGCLSEMCHCPKPTSRECSLCSCHVQRPTPTCKCKKVYQERSCQTEQKSCNCCDCTMAEDESSLYRETKYMTEKRHSTEKREGIEVDYLLEKKYEAEAKKPIDEKYSYQIKVPLETKINANSKDAIQIKNEVENRCPCQTEQVSVKELKGKARCCCQNRDERNKSSNDHPRHYFLQVEETTEEEEEEGSPLSADNRNSLEVITIRVPVRKVCGNRKRGNSLQGAYKIADVGRKFKSERETEGKGCNCYNCTKDESSMFGKTKYMTEKRDSMEQRERNDVNLSEKKCEAFSSNQSTGIPECKCCADCPGRRKSPLLERPRTVATSRPSGVGKVEDEERYNDCLGLEVKFNRPEFASCDEYERRKLSTFPLTGKSTNRERVGYNCCKCKGSNLEEDKYKGLRNNKCEKSDERYPDTVVGGNVSACKGRFPSGAAQPNTSEEEYENCHLLESPQKDPCLSNRENERKMATKKRKEKNGCDNSKNEGSRKFPQTGRPCGVHPVEKTRDNNSKSCDYYNFNKKEFMTKSELEREERKKKATKLTLQECLTVKRPDLYNRAECRRKIISEKSRDRTNRHARKLECFSKLLPRCDLPRNEADLKLFTSAQMKKQTKKYLKNLPEVTMKENEEKKKMQYQTNKLMAEIFAKKLQLQTLRGRLNLSNSFTVMSTI